MASTTLPAEQVRYSPSAPSITSHAFLLSGTKFKEKNVTNFEIERFYTVYVCERVSVCVRVSECVCERGIVLIYQVACDFSM